MARPVRCPNFSLRASALRGDNDASRRFARPDREHVNGSRFLGMNAQIAFGMKLGLSRRHATALARLRTPQKIQDFVNRLPTNFEPEGDTCLSVAEALTQRRAHCIEGAFVAACALWMNGEPPLLMDFQAT